MTRVLRAPGRPGSPRGGAGRAGDTLCLTPRRPPLAAGEHARPQFTGPRDPHRRAQARAVVAPVTQPRVQGRGPRQPFRSSRVRANVLGLFTALPVLLLKPDFQIWVGIRKRKTFKCE